MKLRITRLTFRGEGLGVPVEGDGPALRVAHAVPGDLVEATPLELPFGPRRARLVRVLEPGAERVEAHCAQVLACPGCQLRVLAPEARRAHLVGGWQRVVRRAAGLSREAIEALTAPLVAPGPHDGYRTRATARWRTSPDGRLVAGMTALPGAALGVIDLAACPAQTARARAALAQAVACTQAALGGDRAGRDALGWLVVEHAPHDASGRATWSGGAPAAAVMERAALAFAAAMPGWSALVAVSDADPAAGPPDEARCVAGDGVLRVDAAGARLEARPGDASRGSRHGAGAAGARLEVPPGAWASATPYGAEAVAEVLFGLVDALRPQPEPLAGIVELGCGVGTHSAGLAARATHYVGVDSSRPAIEAASANLRRLGLANATARLGRADRALKRMVVGGLRAELVVVHPMRRGIGDDVARYLAPLGARHVLHVAPSARALADDAAMLQRAGFALEALVPVDTMPHTYHLMALARFARRG